MEYAAAIVLIVLVFVVFSYEAKLDRINVQVSRWKESYWKATNDSAIAWMDHEREVASMRVALRRYQEQNEELEDAFDKFRELFVCGNSNSGDGSKR